MTNPGGGFTTPQQMTDQFGRPVQQQGQQGFPQQGTPQAPQQQFQVPAGTDLNQRVAGAGIPQELQGKTLGEVIRYYGVLREEFRQRNQPQRPLQGQPQQPQAQPQSQQYQPQIPQQQQTGQLYDMDAVQRMTQEAVQRAVAPMQQVNIATVYAAVKARYPDWGNFDALIQQSLAGSPAETLLSPDVWEAAYFHAKGKMASTQPQGQVSQQGQGQIVGWENGQPVYGGITHQNGQPQHQGQGQVYQTPPQYQQPQYQQPLQQYDNYGRPLQAQPQHQYQPQGAPQQYPQQPQYQPQQPYFVEGPTPSMPSDPQQQQASAQDEAWARKFGLTVEQYRAAKGGRIPPMPQQQPQHQPPQQWGQNPQQGGFR